MTDLSNQKRRRKTEHMRNIKSEIDSAREAFEGSKLGSTEEHMAFAKMKHLGRMLTKNRAALKQMDAEETARLRAYRGQTTDKDN